MDARRTTLYNLPPELAEHPQYEVLRELGHGGMGVVYLAKNKLMDRLEVLKVVNKALLDRPGSVERFLREIRSAAKLNHPNVVAAYSALQIGELLVFAMEYVEGEDLDAVVKSRGPLPVVNACQYVQQAAIGLQHAFEKGMVHRDIKPQNLILAREGKKHIVKVLDFGLAKATQEKDLDAGLTGVGETPGGRVTRLAELTGAGQMLGTPGYVAPEQSLDAASADIRADIYSLGCTLYYLLTGQPPYRGKNLTEILQAHQTAEARPLNLVRPEVPEELAALVRKMMAKEPAKRYQTPAEVVQALAAAGKPAAKGVVPKSSPHVSAPASSGRSDDEKRLLRAETIVLPAGAAQATMLGGESASAVAWDSLSTSNIVSAEARRGHGGRNRRAPASWTKWLIGGGISVLLLVLLGLWASGVFAVKTANGTIVLENVPADAEVLVDGATVTLKAGDGETVTIDITAGKKHQLRVKKEGFKVFGQEVEIDSGERRPIRVSLQPDLVREKATKIPAYEHGGGKWSIQGDELIQDSTEVDPAVLLFGDASWTDYEVTVDAKQKEGKELCFIVFRCADLLNSYYFGPWGGRRELHLHTLVDGINKDVVPDRPYSLDDDRWHTLRVHVRGIGIQCFMDGVQIFKQEDDRHRAGYVGLTTPKTATRFRKLKVTAADGRILVGGVGDLEIIREQAKGLVKDQVEAGTDWPGKAYLNERGRNLPPAAIKIKIVKREGTRFEGEYWAETNGGRLKIGGNIDAKGNISWRATEILEVGSGWPPSILDTTFVGTVAGKQMRIYGYLPGLIAELKVRRED